MQRRRLASLSVIALALVMLLGIAPARTANASPGASGNDDALVEGYIEERFGMAASSAEVQLRSRPSSGLSGNEEGVYTQLKPLVAQVAAGERTSTVFELDPAAVYGQSSWTAAELGLDSIVVGDDVTSEAYDAAWARTDFDMEAVLDALIADCPYELYWFDKTNYTDCDLPNVVPVYEGGEWRMAIEEGAVVRVTMPVSGDYRASGQGVYEVDPTTGQRVSTAVENASTIVSASAGLSAYERLMRFKDEICSLTSYNYDAAAYSGTPYGDPWQLVYVFDGDDSTTVVCEGYAKAFQYLCDLANIADVSCYSVTGTMKGATGAGDHMWNLVNMDDGRVYLADVTNCDEDSVGYSNLLFLVPYASGSVRDGYSFDADGVTVTYEYDGPTQSLYSTDELSVSMQPYGSTSDDVAFGTWGTCPWALSSDGVLTVRPGVGASNADEQVSPWEYWSDDILSVVFVEEGGERVVAPAESQDLFGNLRSVVSIDLSGMDASRVENMHGMFSGCSSLVSLEAAGLDTSHVTDMGSMFSGCAKLKELDLSSWDTSSVTDMSRMFIGCFALETLDASGWDTTSATSMAYMFNRCRALVSLDISSWDIPRVTSTRGMFDYCIVLPSVDVSGWDTSSVTDMGRMFADCWALEALDTSDWDTSGVTSMNSMFLDCRSLTSLDTSGWDTSSVTDMYCAFAVCNSLTTLDVSGFDTSHVTNMSHMFDKCRCVSVLDVSGWDTSSVTDMGFMFVDCEVVAALDVSGWDTSSVTVMASLFQGCGRVGVLDVSGFDTSQVTDMYSMFYGCSSVAELDVSGFDTSQVTDMCCMFAGCSLVTELDVSGFDTTHVTDMSGMFSECSSVAELDVSGFDTSAVEKMSGMFSWCESVSSLDVTGFDTSLVADFSGVFCGCHSLATLDITSWDTSAATDMSSLFDGCSSLATLDLSGLDTSGVADMSGMFAGCSSLPTLDVSGLDTSCATDMSGMFYLCSGLTELDVSGFDTSRVEDMTAMFGGCSGLKELGVSGFDTTFVESVERMFAGCSSLVSLDLSGWDTSQVWDMYATFGDCSSLVELDVTGWDTSQALYMDSMFTRCSSLFSLDLSSFSTSSTPETSYMFNECSSLSTIYAGPAWNAETIGDSECMFLSCTSLVGGSGTAYDPEHTGGEYARIDAAGAPGYFSEPGSQSITNISAATFSGVPEVVSYTGEAIEPEVSLLLDGVELVKGVDYLLVFENNVNCSDLSGEPAWVTATGIGRFAGTIVTSFHIDGTSIFDAEIVLSGTSFVYTGDAIEPGVTVTWNGETLVPGVDYEVSYRDNLAVGIAYVDVRGIGNFKNTTSPSFSITEAVEPPALENPFADVLAPGPDGRGGTSHYDDILWLYGSGISTGWVNKTTGERTFRPTSGVQRADMAAFLYRLAVLAGVADPDWQPSDADMARFSDVNPKTPHAREIWWLASAGISTGWKMSDGTVQFRPSNVVVRQDMAAFLFRLACLKDPSLKDWQPTEADREYFSDVNSRTSHAREIWWLASTGVSTGWNMKDGTHQFRGGNTVIRQDMSAFLHRMHGQVLVKAG